MARKSQFTPEERKARERELNRLRVERHRIKHGDLRVGRGRIKDDEEVTTTISDNKIIHRIEKKEPAWRPMPTTQLTKDSKLEDLLPWAMEVAEELRQNPAPAAWASALNSVLKIIEFLDKKIPPTMPDVKPRPRQTIIIEDVKEDEE